MKRFVVMCSTEGGPTGTRQAVLKSGGGVLYFGSESEAQHESMRLNMRAFGINGSAISSQKYWPVSEAEAQAGGYL